MGRFEQAHKNAIKCLNYKSEEFVTGCTEQEH